MSLKIGNVLKAIEEGKWVKVPANAGTFHLKLKQLLPVALFNYRKKIKDKKDQEENSELRKMVVAQIMEFRGLLAADNSEITDQELLKNETFTNVILALSIDPDGESVLNWLVALLWKSDTFAGDDDPDFLASI
jgi:hypothetical protein